MDNGEVSLLLARLGRFGFDEAGRLAEVIILQLLLKRLVGGLREHTLLLKDGEDAHRLKRTRWVSTKVVERQVSGVMAGSFEYLQFQDRGFSWMGSAAILIGKYSEDLFNKLNGAKS